MTYCGHKGVVMTKIMGLDLASKRSGYSVYFDDELIDYGLFVADEKEVNVHVRILDMKKQIIKKIKEHDIGYIIAEQVPVNAHSNLKVGKDLCILQGVLLSVCDDYDVGLELLSPSQWRSVVGSYNGTRAGMKRDYQKEKAVSIVNDMYGFDFKYYKTESKARKSDDDKAEAILLALAYKKILKENKNE